MSGALLSPDMPSVRIDLDAWCHDCRHWHRLSRNPHQFAQEVWDWEAKHRGHTFEFLTPKRVIPRHFDDHVYEQAGIAPWWLEYKENADLKIAYAASAAMTMTLASLAPSSTLLVGRNSTAIVNTTNKYIDWRASVKTRVNATVTANGEIRVYAYCSLDDVPAYPIATGTTAATGTDAGLTFTAEHLASSTVFLGATVNNATGGSDYTPRCVTIAQAFGHAPTHWALWLTHSTHATNALDATAGNHAVSQTGVYFTSV